MGPLPEIGIMIGRRLVESAREVTHWVAEEKIRKSSFELVKATDALLEQDRWNGERTQWDVSESWGRPVDTPPPPQGMPIRGMDENGRELVFWTGDVRKATLYHGMGDLAGVSYAPTRGVAAFLKRTRWHNKLYAHGTFSVEGNRIEEGESFSAAWWPSDRAILVHADADPDRGIFHINADVAAFDVFEHDYTKGTQVAVEPEMLAKVIANDPDIRQLSEKEPKLPLVMLAGNLSADNGLLGAHFAEALHAAEGFPHDIYLSRGAQIIWEPAAGRSNFAVEGTGDLRDGGVSLWELHPALPGADPSPPNR
ncbi:hypothetical protein IU483_18580 [Streptomyces gardneri]|nr:hypothetical protein [Streptomyces gardneri]